MGNTFDLINPIIAMNMILTSSDGSVSYIRDRDWLRCVQPALLGPWPAQVHIAHTVD